MRWAPRWRRERPDLQVWAGEQVLAWATDSTGEVVGGTRDALYLPASDGARIPWQEIEAAEWDLDTSMLTVREVAPWGLSTPEHQIIISEPGRLLELVRERVTASIVLQRHVAVAGRRGVRVIARRAPHGHQEISWFFEYDEGVDPDDPSVQAVAEAALVDAQHEVEPG